MVIAPWKWLGRPLTGAARSRRELTWAIVLSGAAIAGLSTVIRPDPAKLAARAPIVAPVVPSVAELRPENARVEPATEAKVSTEFASAVARGDVDAMNRLAFPKMPLDGMLAVGAESGRQLAVVWLLEHGADVHEDEDTADAPVLLADDHPDVAYSLLVRGAHEPSLAMAARAVATHTVHRLLAGRVDRKDGSPLYEVVASKRGSADERQAIIEKLLAAGIDPNGTPNGGDLDEINPLTAAVQACFTLRDGTPVGASTEECLPIIEMLVRKGARARGRAIVGALSLPGDSAREQVLHAVLEARLEPGATAMALAQAPTLDPTVVKTLVARGIDWSWHDGEDDAALPLMAVIQRGDRDGARLLLQAGAPANAQFKDGTCVLGDAIDATANGGAGDYERIVELLIARGADVNRRFPDGRTPLFAAAESGNLRVINALLDRGARLNDVVLDDSPLDAAEQHDHLPAARALHARGARRAHKSANAHSFESP